VKISSGARGGAMGHLHPKPKLLGIRSEGVFAFYLRNLILTELLSQKFNITVHTATPKPNFYATPLVNIKQMVLTV